MLMNQITNWFWSMMSVDEEDRHVGMRSALGYPAVWYAHNKLVGDVGVLPVDVKRRKGEGSVNDTGHDGYRLLREEPNAVQSPSTFKEQITSHAIMHGNGRAAIMRAGETITEIIPLMPDRTQTYLSRGEKYHVTKPMEPGYNDFLESRSVDGMLVFRDEDVLHITGFSYDGVVGLGLLDLARNAIGIGLDAQKHIGKGLQRGFAGKVFLEAPPGTFRKQDEAEEFISKFNEAESGPDNAGKAGLLREGIKASRVSHSNSESQMLDLMRFSRQDVGLLFGIAAMPGDDMSVSYNSLEQQNLAYLVALSRWLLKWEEECDRKLRTASQKRRQSHYFKFNTAALLRTDLQSTMTALGQAITYRIMNPNEARAKLDMSPYSGGEKYENPAITPGGKEKQSDDSPDEQPKEKQSGSENKAALEMVRGLIQREANDAINGTNSDNFLIWIDKNYRTFERKFADKLEAIGVDRQLASNHCDKSKELLLDIAGRSTVAHLKANVTAAVKEWKNRAYQILENNNHAGT